MAMMPRACELRKVSCALAILEAAFGPEHPRVAANLANLGAACGDLGDFARARELLERTAALRASFSAACFRSTCVAKPEGSKGTTRAARTLPMRRSAALLPHGVRA